MLVVSPFEEDSNRHQHSLNPECDKFIFFDEGTRNGVKQYGPPQQTAIFLSELGDGELRRSALKGVFGSLVSYSLRVRSDLHWINGVSGLLPLVHCL